MPIRTSLLRSALGVTSSLRTSRFASSSPPSHLVPTVTFRVLHVLFVTKEFVLLLGLAYYAIKALCWVDDQQRKGAAP